MTFTTATKIEIINAAYEASNGLTIGWQLGNVRDDAKRAELQAPVIAGQEAMMTLIRKIEGLAIADGDAGDVSEAIYGERNSIEHSRELVTM